MRIAVVGARGQLGAAVVHECAAAHDVDRVRRAPTLDVTDDAAVAVALRARRAGRDRQLRGLQRRRRGGGSTRSRRSTATRSRSGRWRARRGARRDARALQHRFRVRRHARRRRTPKTTGRTRAASTRRRSCSASGSRATRRARTCCASRACSVARPGGGRRRAASPAIVEDAAGRRVAEGVRGPDGVADLRHRCGARDARSCSSARRRPACITASTRGAAPGSSSRARLARPARPSSAAGCVPVRMSDMHAPGARGRCICALSNDKLRSVGIDMPPWQDALGRTSPAVRRQLKTRHAAYDRPYSAPTQRVRTWRRLQPARSTDLRQPYPRRSRSPAVRPRGTRSGRASRCRPPARPPGSRGRGGS